MMRSMFSGVSGLRAHQVKMDVIGNNISNVNTIGYKSSRVTFQEAYNQKIKDAMAPAADSRRGGINPQQVGLGVSVASIDVVHTQGGVQRTDKATDLAIEGDGYFVVSDGVSNYYTRAGNFDIDKEGYLVSASGLKVQGWMERDTTGEVTSEGKVGEINLANLSMPPRSTSRIKFEGNLDSTIEYNWRTEKNGRVEYTTSIFDSLGEEHKILLTFERVGHGITTAQGEEVTDPAIINGEDLEINGVAITLGTSYTDIQDIVDDIEGSLPSGVTVEAIDGAICFRSDENNITIGGDAAPLLGFTTVAQVTGSDVTTTDYSSSSISFTVNGNTVVLDEDYGSIEGVKDAISDQLLSANIDVRLDGDKLVLTANDLIEISGTITGTGLSTGTTYGERTIEAQDNYTTPNVWNLTITPYGEDTKIESPSELYDGIVRFDENGNIESPITIELEDIEFSNGAKDIDEITIEFDQEKVVQRAAETTFKLAETDGYGAGVLDNISIDPTGRITGIYSNGQTRVDAIIALAKFNNPAGLYKLGNNLFQVSSNSGNPDIGAAGMDGRGEINPGTLEMSNVDLAKEFTEMIITQRGFQANSRIITTSDELLQEMVNLKR